MSAGPARLPAVAGVVLAGGMSRRMGAPKHALVLPDGTTLLERVARALAEHVSFVAVAGLDEAPAGGAGPAMPAFPDLHPGLGPLAGVHAVLARLDVAGCLFAACDQPFLDGGVLRPLAAGPRDRARCLISEGSGDLVPLPCYLPRGCLPQVEEELLRGRRSLYGLLETLGADRIPVPAALEPRFRSIDTPEVWTALRTELDRPAG